MNLAVAAAMLQLAATTFQSNHNVGCTVTLKTEKRKLGFSSGN
jgi:hypothetical protein